jgi:hypothetical protein
MCTNAFFHNKEKTLRAEHLNLDNMNSKEKEEIIFKMKKQLETMAELPISNDSFFSSISKQNPLQAQFNIWKRNLFVPLGDQLEEQAKRKIREIEEKAKAEENKDNIFAQEKRDLHNPEEEMLRMDRHQAILKQHLSEERKKQGLDPLGEYEPVKPSYEKDPMEDSVDSLPVKRTKKWRIW